MAFPSAFVSVDWSQDARKRSVHVVDLERRSIRREERPDWSLAALLEFARGLRSFGPVLIGIDAVLGVPAGYWAQVTRHERWRGVESYLDWLEGLDPESEFFTTVHDPVDWRVERPFFQVPGVLGGLTAFQDRAGGHLLRRIDLSIRAKPMFAVSGIPGTVGSGTRVLWRELIPFLQRTRDFAVWPFDGNLEILLATQRIVLAETYPALAYAAALASELPTASMPIAKTQRAARERACELLEGAAWVRESAVELGDLEAARENEDAFDSHLTAAAILRCVLDEYPLCDPEWIDPFAEGGMLPAGPVDPGLRAKWLWGKEAASGAGGKKAVARATSSHGAPPGKYACPIPGCSKVFRLGRCGWDGHVVSLRAHPDWYPDVEDAEERKRLFRREYGDWLA